MVRNNGDPTMAADALITQDQQHQHQKLRQQSATIHDQLIQKKEGLIQITRQEIQKSHDIIHRLQQPMQLPQDHITTTINITKSQRLATLLMTQSQ